MKISKPKASEANIQRAIIDWLTVHKIPHAVTDASRIWGPDGKPRKSKVDKSWPDITAILKPSGRALFIEVKSATARFKPGQQEKHAELIAAGAIVIVPRSIDDFIKKISLVLECERSEKKRIAAAFD